MRFAATLIAVISAARLVATAPAKDFELTTKQVEIETGSDAFTLSNGDELTKRDTLNSVFDALGDAGVLKIMKEFISDESTKDYLITAVSNAVDSKDLNVTKVYDSLKNSKIFEEFLLAISGSDEEQSIQHKRKTDEEPPSDEVKSISALLKNSSMIGDFTLSVLNSTDLAETTGHLIKAFAENANLTSIVDELEGVDFIADAVLSDSGLGKFLSKVSGSLFSTLDSSSGFNSETHKFGKRDATIASDLDFDLSAILASYREVEKKSGVFPSTSTNSLSQSKSLSYGLDKITGTASSIKSIASETTIYGVATSSPLKDLLITTSAESASENTDSASLNSLVDGLFDMLNVTSTSTSSQSSSSSLADEIINLAKSSIDDIFKDLNKSSTSQQNSNNLSDNLISLLQESFDSLIENVSSSSSILDFVDSIFSIVEYILELLYNNILKGSSTVPSTESTELVRGVLLVSKNAISKTFGSSALEKRDSNGGSFLDIIFEFIEKAVLKIFQNLASGSTSGSGIFLTIFSIAKSAISSILKFKNTGTASSNVTSSSDGSLLDDIFDAFFGVLKSTNISFSDILAKGVNALESNSGSGKSFLQIILEDVLDLFQNGIGAFLRDLVNLFVKLLFGNSSSSLSNGVFSGSSTKKCCCSSDKNTKILKRNVKRQLKSSLKASLIKRMQLKRK